MAQLIVAGPLGKFDLSDQERLEPALLTILNERLKSADVTVSHSRRWSDFEEYLSPRLRWVNECAQHYAALDNQTNFLRHFLHLGGDSRLSPAARRRNALAALIAIGCNIGPQRMAVASGLSLEEISLVADWYLTEDALKAASIDIINFASRAPLSRLYGLGDTCSADGMRFYVPINILAADYSHELQGRGVKLYAHTSNNCFRINQQLIPCRLREAAFALDGLGRCA